MNDVVERLMASAEEEWPYAKLLSNTGSPETDNNVGRAVVAMLDAIAEIERLEAENAKLREFFEVVFKDLWDLHDPDGGDLQDTAERLGLIVKVPADEQFRDEYDGDEMFVWSWSPLATEALSHHLPPDDGDTG